MLNSYQYAETLGSENSPLIFTFHGTGGNEHQFHQLAEKLIPHAHVISPRGDVDEFGAARFFRRLAEGKYDMADLRQRTKKMADFMQAHQQRLNATAVWGLGYSNGANILASVILDQPKRVQKAVLMHPLIPWQPDPNKELENTSILITAGKHDPICPVHHTQTLVDYLTSQNVQINTFWHDGGHNIDQSEIAAIQAFVQQS